MDETPTHVDPADPVIGRPTTPFPTDGARLRPRTRSEIVKFLAETGLPVARYRDLEEPLLTTSQVAVVLRTTDRTIRTWADANKIGVVRTLGGRRLFPLSSVLRALESMVAGRTANAANTTPDAAHARTNGTADAGTDTTSTSEE